MNHLIVGFEDKTERFLQFEEVPSLWIDEGSHAVEIAEKYRARIFDPTIHSFNPLTGITPKLARDFATAVYGDKDLMTYRNGKRALARMLVKGKQLDQLPEVKHSGYDDARETVDDILFSPVLSRVLCSKPNFTFDVPVVAKLDRALLGEQDAFMLAALLIGQVKGQIVVHDGGFYLRELHGYLIRENRLTVGVTYLAECSPKLRQALLTIKDKKPVQAVFDDADTLAKFAGFKPGDQGYSDFVAGAMRE